MIDPERRRYIFAKLGYTPHGREQWDCHNSTERFRLLVCGRRWGKTTFGANELTAALVDPTQVGYYWIVGPNYVQGEKEFRIVYDNIIRKLKFGNKVKKQYNRSQGTMFLEMPWGSVLEVKSAERKESLLGEGLSGVIMAEAARHDVATWEQYVRPALADKRGWGIFTTTPRGYNWLYGLWMMGQTGLYPEYKSWRLPSWTNLVSFPGGRDDPEIKQIERDTSAMFFAQEYAAEFTAFTGKIYPEFDPAIHVKELTYNPKWRNYWAMDFGYNNPFVCLDIGVDASENVYVWREYIERYKSTWEHGHTLKARKNPPGFHVDAMFGDPRGADEIATLALVLGLVWGRDVPWKMGVEAVKRWLKIQPNGLPRLYIDSKCATTIFQLEQLRAPDEHEGRNPMEGQHKHNDHCPDALRYFFGEYFVLGAGASLSDLYAPRELHSEGHTYFQQDTPFVRD